MSSPRRLSGSASSGVRTAARAVILRGEEILAVRIRTEEGEFLVLPGGGQNHGETLRDTVRREVFEELPEGRAAGPSLSPRVCRQEPCHASHPRPLPPGRSCLPLPVR
ncbi:MAG: NUDIX domain-containing protein [Verrucomicrobiota bacterium]